MHGIGNDFVMIDRMKNADESLDWSALSVSMCDRKFGVGADGLILAEPGKNTQFAMRMFNPDGSESEMCGNGVRCFALYVRDNGHTSETEIPVETGAGLLHLSIQGDGQVKVDMGVAKLTRGEIGMSGPADELFINQPLEGFGLNGTAVSMGNPHVVIFTDDVSAIPLEQIGPQIERNSLFPSRVNVHFVQIVGDDHIVQRTWERGAGITLACGTGACACAVASHLNGYTDRSVDIDLPGGRLHIDYHEHGRVDMTGPAVTVFEADWK